MPPQKKNKFIDLDGSQIIGIMAIILTAFSITHDITQTILVVMGLFAVIVFTLGAFNIVLKIIFDGIRFVLEIIRFVLTLKDRVEMMYWDIRFIMDYLYVSDPDWMKKASEERANQEKLQKEHEEQQRKLIEKYEEQQ